MISEPRSVLFIEEQGRWQTIAVSLYGCAIHAESLHPDSWTSGHQISGWVGIEYSPVCLEKWFSLFDKSPASLENLNWTLLNAPTESVSRNRLYELGFTGFVYDVSQLRHNLDRWLGISHQSVSVSQQSAAQQIASEHHPSKQDLRTQLLQSLPARLTRKPEIQI